MLATGNVLELLINLLIVGLVIWAINWFIDTVITLPPNVKMIAKIILGIVALIWLLRLIGVGI